MAAINVLGVLHDIESIPKIRTYLKNRMLSVQGSAITVLANLNDTESIPEIRKIAANESNYMSRTAFKALGTFHDIESIPIIRQLIGNKRAPSEAIETIATFRDEEAVLAIKDNNYQLDSTSVKALATLHDSESIAEIRKLVLNKSVQTAAVEALAALHDAESIAEIRRFLGSAEPNLQVATVKALGWLHDSRAVPAIRRLIGKGDWQVQEAAIRALGMLNDKKAIPQINDRLADRYPDIQFAAAQALARLNHSSPQLLAWQQQQLAVAREKAASEYPAERTEAAKNLASIFTQESIELLDKLMDDAEQSVVMPAVESLGIIGEYAPGLVQKQISKLLALTNHDHLDLQEEAVNALGRLISFRGKEKAMDFSETDQKIRSVFRAFILDKEPKNSFRRTVAADALGATGRRECASDFASLLQELKDDPRYYRCLYWMKRLEADDSSGDALQKKLQKELDELTASKELWRQKRDKKQGSPSTDATFTSNAEQDNDAWRMEPMEHLLGNALSRIDSEKTGIELLGHSLYQVRQGAIRALAAKADAALIGNIIQAHQDFDPDDLPSPFPYAAFQAIDLSLWNLEYTGTAADLTKLQDILKTVPEKSNIPGQEGAIKERLEWTIKRLEEKNIDTTAAKFTQEED